MQRSMHCFRLLFSAAAAIALVPATRLVAQVDYERDVLPILSARCFACHGAERQRKNLRLDLEAAVMKGGLGGPALVRGNSKKSLMMRRVRGLVGKRMPPEGPALSAREIETIAAWIDAGASRPESREATDPELLLPWAYRQPKKSALPRLEQTTWPKNEIDHFVLARLEERGLAPSPEAERGRWLRRVSLDLLGLPPTMAELSRFLQDRKAGAHERAVDRLLMSPHWGEQRARRWLDLARYADTKGYEKDARRSVWLYRDWVISAFNEDMPFDRFTTLQIAGDLLPATENADERDRRMIATAFHRLTMTNDEGGTDDEEFRVEAVADRVETTMSVWMGTTMNCARCHDHKYDPITQREYYQLFAFFNQSKDSDKPDDRPRYELAKGLVRKRVLDLEARLAKARADFAKRIANDAAFDAWLDEQRKRLETTSAIDFGPWRQIGPFEGRSGRQAHDHVWGPERAIEPERGHHGKHWKPVRGLVEGRPQALSGERRSWYFHRRFELPEPRRVLLSLGSDDAIKVWVDGQGRLARWVQRGVKIDQEKLWLDLSAGKHEVLVKVTNDGGRGGWFAEFRDLDLLPRERKALASKDAKTPGSQASKILRAAWLRVAESLAQPRRRVAELVSELARARKGLPSVPVMRELPKDKRRTTHLLVRGSFLNPGEVVEPGTPGCFPAMPADAPKNRLGLARWLADPKNPLPARLVVNRAFEELLGRGLVASSEDWGTQAERPSHPKLLDWLALRFVEDGWSLKKLYRRIVLSATYRQSSRVAVDSRDPSNAWFSRGPRHRLPAETIRDQALAVSGLLNRELYGPSVMPPQPAGVWSVVYSGDKWVNATGPQRYRRGVYTFVRRTSPHPAMVAFDAPSREVCTVRRVRTNTPVQALVTLNDPCFVEAAQALARAVMRAGESGGDDVARLELLFARCLARRPTPKEQAKLLRFLASERQGFAKEPARAKAFATSKTQPMPQGLDLPTLAAWTALAHVVLNLDEFLTKH